MSEIKDLVHVERTLPSGAYVLILNSGAAIKPEGRAMLQALHSRSVGGIKSHLQTLIEKGPEKFMKTYFVGYGHKSIGDMAECVMFVEGISMLCTKAIQDNRLYRGQEASTRYIDFAKQRFIDPVGTELSCDILENWRHQYAYARAWLTEHLSKLHPRPSNESEDKYWNAILAAAYDRSRCLLPAGASTNIAWTGDFRTVSDKLNWLRHHPLPEVRQVALAIEDALIEMHPSGFSNKRYEASERYYAETMRYYYFNPSTPPIWWVHDDTNHRFLEEGGAWAIARPPKTELPKWLEEAGTVTFEFALDFGSFRDLQRHRAVSQRMPLLTTNLGFEQWYLDEMPSNLRNLIATNLPMQEFAISALMCEPEIAQYYIPMGYRVPLRLNGNLPALVYLIELRATRFTHPTLRAVARRMGTQLEQRFGKYGLQIHFDPDPDRFDIRRGEQTIIEQEVA